MRSLFSFVLRLLLVAALLIAAAVGLQRAGILQTSGNDGTSGTGAPASKFATAEIGPGVLQLAIQANGKLALRGQQPVFSEISGRLRELHIDYGQPIRRGQVLALIDDREYQAVADELAADHASAEADRQAVNAKLAHARSEARRQARLLNDGLIPRVDADNARALVRELEAQLAAADARVQRAATRLQQARADLDKAEVVSPIDGVLVGIEVKVGEVINALSQPLFQVAPNFDDLIIEAEIDESDIGKVRVGQLATYEVDAHPGEIFTAEVRSVRPAGREVRGVTVYAVELAADNPEGRLYPGMSARVTIEAEDREADLLLPVSALLFTPDPLDMRGLETQVERLRNRGDTLVWVLNEAGGLVPVGVELGAQDEDFIELLGDWNGPTRRVVTGE